MTGLQARVARHAPSPPKPRLPWPHSGPGPGSVTRMQQQVCAWDKKICVNIFLNSNISIKWNMQYIAIQFFSKKYLLFYVSVIKAIKVNFDA